MDNSITVCFREKYIYTWYYFLSAERSVTLSFLSMARKSEIAQGKAKSLFLFLKTPALLHLLSRINPMEKKKSLKVFRTETCFQCHSGKPGTHLLSSEEGLNQSATGDLMKQIIEHSLIQVITYGKAQKISKLPVHWLNY